MESRWEVRRLAPSTKLALANALKKLLQKKFLDDITVKELVEECEVNRQTFYYHFQDIYDLLRWFLEHETSEALRGADCWQDALRAAFRYVQDNHLPSITYTAPADGTTWTATFSAWPVPSPPPLWRRVHGTCPCRSGSWISSLISTCTPLPA